MHTGEREKEIMSILERTDYATVEYLAKKIHISESSIRRDLTRLETKGLITRSYGGAEIKNSGNRQIPFGMRSHQNTHAKLAVAQKAVSLIKQGDVVFLDGSTSTYFMVDYLRSVKDVTVITNSLAGMTLLSETGINSYLAGGQLNPENRSCCIGPHTVDFISRFYADLCFFSVQSLAKDGVLYDCFSNEISPRKIMMENSEKRVFLCDGSKVDHYSAYRLCTLSDIDIMISDINPENHLEKHFDNVRFISAEA